MAKRHWYRNIEQDINRLFSDSDIIPEGFSRENYSVYMSDLQAGENHWHYGKHNSEETNRKISEGNKGKIVSDATRRKMSIAASSRDWSNFHPDHRGEKNPRYGKGKPLTPEKNEQFQRKRYQTMKKNNSFNTSKPEEDYYKLLLESYSAADIIRQYSSGEYPFRCDFYIKSENKYIELNAHWTHGGKPYDPDDIECQEKLATWKEKAKTSQFFANAIKTWTERDVEKQRVAKENNLNIEFIY